MNKVTYIVYNQYTYQIIDTFYYWGKRIMNLLDSNTNDYRYVDVDNPMHQEALEYINEWNRTNY